MDMRNIIREDEDWIANPRGPATVTPAISNAERMERATTAKYSPGGTWDFSILDDDDETPESDSTSASKPITRTTSCEELLSKLNKWSAFRDCSHAYERVYCRCTSQLGISCTKCEEPFCSEVCTEKPINKELRWPGTGDRVVKNCLIPGRGGHRQGLGRGQRQMQRWPK